LLPLTQITAAFLATALSSAAIAQTPVPPQASRISWIRKTTLSAELLRRSAQTQASRRENDLEFELSIEFIESIAGANKRPPINGQHAT
jgi:hypothetical protein